MIIIFLSLDSSVKGSRIWEANFEIIVVYGIIVYLSGLLINQLTIFLALYLISGSLKLEIFISSNSSKVILLI